LFALLGAMLVAYRLSYSRTSVSTRFALAMDAARDVSFLSAGFLLVIAAVFTTHVAISPNPPNAHTPAGQKDLRFVSPTYLDYLEQRRELSPQVVLTAATDYLRFIVADEAGIPKTDANGSHPYTWPFHFKTINYRWDSNGGRTAYSQLAGNPVGWAAALLATVSACVLLYRRPRAVSAPRQALMTMLVLLYGVFMAAHLYLDKHRVLYLYHYFPALLIGFCLCPLVLQDRLHRFRWSLYGLTALLLASFLFYAPLSFHRPLTPTECERRNFLQPVVDCQG
jgi:hypothetical protein